MERERAQGSLPGRTFTEWNLMVELKGYQIRKVFQRVDQVRVVYRCGKGKMSGLDHVIRAIEYCVEYVVCVGIFEGRLSLDIESPT